MDTIDLVDRDSDERAGERLPIVARVQATPEQVARVARTLMDTDCRVTREMAGVVCEA